MFTRLIGITLGLVVAYALTAYTNPHSWVVQLVQHHLG